MRMRLPFIDDLLGDLALQDDVGGRPGERGRSSNAGRVTHAQAQAFGQPVVLFLQRLFPGLQL